MRAYVINLTSRTDRWDACTTQWTFKSIPLHRIEAVESSSIPKEETEFLPTQVVANWQSQCRTFREFLSTSESHALVLEDDFMLGGIELTKYVNYFQSGNFDFLQLGYLNNSLGDRFNVFAVNMRDLILKLLNRVAKRFSKMRGLLQKLLVSEQSHIPFSIVMNDPRAGSHAYLISREFAENMLLINKPTFLATDGLFIAIGNLRFLKMGRLRKNLVKQSDSPSSITSRFIER